MTQSQINKLLGIGLMVSLLLVLGLFAMILFLLSQPASTTPLAGIPTNDSDSSSSLTSVSEESTVATPSVSASAVPTTKLSLPSPPQSAIVASTLGGCPMFPPNNVWNARVDSLPVDPHSANYVNAIGANTGLHPDFGSALWEGAPIGIPYNLVPGTLARVPIQFDYSGESDAGPYPIPPSPLMERPSDSHLLVVDTGNCVLYETWDTRHQNGWTAGSGAKFDLKSNTLRPAGWTSADAAGLPILPGLVRYSEVASGEIKHAIRFTIDGTNGAHIWPARHKTSSPVSPSKPPMGQRFRLKAAFDLSSFSHETQVILTALKRYGMIVADNGSNWYVSGSPDPHWKDETLVTEFRRVHGSDFEAVDESGLMVDPNSGQVK